jgi:aminopeptidase N
VSRSARLAFAATATLLVADGVGVESQAAPQQWTGTAPAGRLHHSLRLTLDPSRHWIAVKDTLSFPAEGPREVQFLLSAALHLTNSDPAVAPLAGASGGRFLGINASTEGLLAEGKLKRYGVTLPPRSRSLRVEYEGRFDFGLADQKQEYTRGFRETLGIVSPEGVYLAGSGFFYPYIDERLVEFDLEAPTPEGWHLICPGNGTSRDEEGVARWDSHGPVDEITVVGGPLVVYRDAAGPVETFVYLRQKDDALAGRYLTATAQYLEMYRGLIGSYPYGKFALVENFWETGYGMPSYTLLGSQVIRFPFILTSSYPHEILHNWWGNSVFVDYETGNWCEGLTAYMADHLIQEQRGRGEEYRRDTLQKYRNYVKGDGDFPLSEFRSRHSAATEAVGYGKTLMVFHMLRERVGDDAFQTWARTFYREYDGKRAGFVDVRKSFEAASGQDLGRFFADHVGRAGAAALEVEHTAERAMPEGSWEVSGVLKETQPGTPLLLDVPVVVQTSGAPASVTVRIEGREAPFQVKTDSQPVALHVDPWFDVFRLLDPRETPPSIGQIFGEPRILAVLPSDAGSGEVEGYRALVEGWRSESHQPEIRTDAEVTELPADRAVWLLGRTNRLAARLFSSGSGFTIDGQELVVEREAMPLAGHSAVIVRRHPGNVEKAVGWIFSEPLAALPGLGRKLPHYGKYSYLGFEGDEPANVLKGQWAATDSPLRVDLRPAGERGTAMAALALPPRKALAELPPVFSRKDLMAHVEWLSAPEREGRGIGTKGLDAAADYVAAQFKAIGLAPGGEAGTYFQPFASPRSPSGTPVTLRNVIGVLQGTKADWKGQSALLTAHYDHLGFGWPDVHKGDEGRLHPGADDNASGVAVMLELAKVLAAGGKPRRTIVFVAFSGEEAGLLGSRHYVEHPVFPLDRTIGVIDLDTVGRLFDGKISVIATGSASEWQHIFRGAGFVTGVEGQMIPEPLESSDQKSFIDAGVPAVQIFTGAHADYHRPGDTADKIDAAGLVKVATYVKEAIQYLGEREEPLTNTILGTKGDASATAPAATKGAPGGTGRRVSFGSVPDFAFAGPGVRVSGVTPGSPAEKAGVKEGDVLLKVDGKHVADLRGFSDILRGLAPGQTVKAVVMRGGQELTLDVTVVER